MTLQAVGLGFTYPGRPVLEGWSADLVPGRLTALTGPSGRGKSTLLYLLGLLLRPAQGELRLDGERISGLGDRERARLRARRFGFVFQDAALDASRTVLDNITEGAVYRLEDRRLLRQRAADLLDQLGVDVPLQRRPGEISGGQAQRIALCRALIHAPTVLLADEPTGNLDAASAGVVLDALAHAADAGAVVVIATHDERVVARCEQVERL